LEPPKKSSSYLSGYASGFFVVSASFRQNSHNAHDGTIFHHPAKATKDRQVLIAQAIAALPDVRSAPSLATAKTSAKKAQSFIAKIAKMGIT
jgi:hypothetical protein